MRLHRTTVVCSILAAAVYVTAGLHVARTASATSDEVPHIGAGLYYLRGDLRLNREHPPLIKVLSALALPRDGRMPPLPDPLPSVELQWDVGRSYLKYGPEPALSLLFRARTPIVLLNSLLLVALALVSTSISGPLAACIVVWMAALCPLWLAHSTLVTTDGTATLFFFVSAALAAQLLRCQSARSKLGVATALAFALAGGLATKYSLLSALGFIPLGFALDALRLRRPRLIYTVAFAAFGGAVLGVGLAWGWPPKPGIYVDGLGIVGANHRKDGGLGYAFGTMFRGLDPIYFPRALLVKVSLPVLVLALLAPILRLAWRRLPDHDDTAATPWGCFVVPPVGYFLLLAYNAPPIGVRYVLPVLPFIFLAAAHAGAALVQHVRARWLLLPLAAAHVLSFVVALRASPLAFFNGLMCRTSGIPPCLDDSNVDWGQALPALARYRDQHHPGTHLRLLYFGSSWPETYLRDVSEASVQDLLAPQRALYAVSLHFLARMPEDAWPMKLEPLEVVAGTYAVYDLRAQREANARR